MVAFVKNSTNYGLYILEDNLGADEWLTDHDHIKEVDWTLGTEGVDCVYLPFSGKIEQMPEFVFDIMDTFNGAGNDMSLGEGHWIFKCEGRFGGTSESNRNTKMENFLKFYMKHLSFGKATLYLGYRKLGEVWEPFIDESETVKYYLKGKLVLATYSRDEFQNFYSWKIAFQGVQ